MNEKHANATIETYKHIKLVRDNLNLLIKDLIDRAANHDNSKLETPEVEIFGEHTEELGKCEYGTPDYKKCVDLVRPAVDHHQSKNRHHPEFHKEGIDGMSLIDLLEMLCDWRAATFRHVSGNIRKSIEINAQRFKISPQLRQIMENTVKEYFD